MTRKVAQLPAHDPELPPLRRSPRNPRLKEICPISREDILSLGSDRFESATDGGRYYSASALRAWLLASAETRPLISNRPHYVSPVSRRDMVVDAVRLGLPAQPKSQQEKQHRFSVALLLGLGVCSSVVICAFQSISGPFRLNNSNFKLEGNLQPIFLKGCYFISGENMTPAGFAAGMFCHVEMEPENLQTQPFYLDSDHVRDGF